MVKTMDRATYGVVGLQTLERCYAVGLVVYNNDRG